MPSQNSSTSSLFSFVMADKGGRRTTEFLNKMNDLVPWKEIGDELAPALYDGHLGRPGFPVHTLIKALFLELWYGLSDPELEEQILDRISFQRFLEVKDRTDIPDETTVCRFRNKLVELHAENELFEVVDEMIDNSGYRIDKGTIVDATIIEAPKGKKRNDGTNTRDKDAGFTKKNGRCHHGYKIHDGSDVQGQFLKKPIITSATTPDSEAFDDLTKNEKYGVYGDKAFVNKEKKKDFRKRGIFWGILDRASVNHPLSKKQKKDNRQKSSVRCHVEHPFAWIKKTMKLRCVRFRGLRKNTFHLTLICAAYNLRRLLSLKPT
ncbi:MAG: IS5 family transposase [Candidatus Uhrbacteria bacterium]